MRKDMAKVIVERPRWGSRLPSRKKGYRKYLQTHGLENLPRHEPLPGRWRGRQKSLNEHLGPMRRFLRSRVGRLWNKVHQELCEHVSFDNSVQKHILTHVFQFVEQFVELRGPEVIVSDGHTWRRGRKLRAGDMYVCPKTGILKRVRPRNATFHRNCVGRGQSLQFHRRGQSWWEVRLCRRPAEPGEQWDAWLGCAAAQVTIEECLRNYGWKAFANSCRPLTRSEAKLLQRRLRKSNKACRS
jgi:hypothetical protein